jgi:UDP:flavonoid glycosyltransferase YjiC (YdhE family)
LQSTEEVIENAVPVIGFPIFSDQLFNMKKIQSFGAGKWLHFPEVSKKILKETILEVITNSR